MPIVTVRMFEGRSIEKKRKLVKQITEVVSEVLEVEAQYVHVVIDEMKKENWGREGILAVDRK